MQTDDDDDDENDYIKVNSDVKMMVTMMVIRMMM